MSPSHVYGPVPSRRLGRSLGVDLIPPKTCNYSCVYCQLGRTTTFTNQRQAFFPREKVWQEVQARVAEVGVDAMDYITFVGDGEPTLSADLGWFLERVAAAWDVPTAVITNGALLYDSAVRAELMHADVVLPTLDAATEKTFRVVNRPHKTLEFSAITAGLRQFTRDFPGEVWLEVMLVAGINDTDAALAALADLILEVSPARVYLNVPIRPPAEPWVKIPPQGRITHLEGLLGGAVDICLPEEGAFVFTAEDEEGLRAELVATIQRHPMRHDQVLTLLEERDHPDPARFLAALLAETPVETLEHEGTTFYEWTGYTRGE